jgi:hypothetical protein
MDVTTDQKDQAASILSKLLSDGGMDEKDAAQLSRVVIEKAAAGDIPGLPARRTTTEPARVAYDASSRG